MVEVMRRLRYEVDSHTRDYSSRRRLIEEWQIAVSCALKDEYIPDADTASYVPHRQLLQPIAKLA